MTFGEILKKLRVKAKLSQEELAVKIDVKKNTVSNYENNVSKPHYETLVKICDILKTDPNTLMVQDIKLDFVQKLPIDIQELISKYKNLTKHDKTIVDYILNMEQIKQYSDNTNNLIDMGEIIEIKTYTEPVSAGEGNVVMYDNPIPKLYPSTPISSKASYCVRISGDSMYPEFLNGDIVYVNNKEIPVNGDIGIFLYNGESYCKKYFKKNNTEKLISLNPNQDKYKPILIENESFQIQGKVIGKFHAD